VGVKLEDICEILNGYAFKSNQYVNEGFRIIRITNVQKGYVEDNNPVFYPIDNCEAQKYILNEDDLLISLTGNVGRVALLNKKYLPAVLNQRVACLRVKNNANIDKVFLFNFLNSDYFERKCIESAKGIAQKNMSTEWLKRYEIPFFSIEEQQKIATVLDKVSELITLRKKQLEKLDELVKSRFVEMFGDTVINSFNWEEHFLDEYIEFLTSGSRGWAQFFVDEENELFITIKNVKNNHISLDSIQYINAPDNKEAQRTKVKTGDLLISITADLGRTGVVDEKIAARGAYINQHLSLVRLDQKKVNPLYVSHFLETDGGKKQFESKNQNGVKAGLNFDAIRSLKILVPPLEKQNEYLDFVQQVDKQKSSIQQSLEKLEVLKKALMQEYFG